MIDQTPNDGWHTFSDNHGVNNAHPIGDGWELHVHEEGFGGYANFQNQSLEEKLPLSPGDALYAAAMSDFAKRFGEQ